MTLTQALNSLVIIGYIGVKRCYLNISREKAFERYCTEEKIPNDEEQFDGSIEEITFTDTFNAYDIWEE